MKFSLTSTEVAKGDLRPLASQMFKKLAPGLQYFLDVVNLYAFLFQQMSDMAHCLLDASVAQMHNYYCNPR